MIIFSRLKQLGAAFVEPLSHSHRRTCQTISPHPCALPYLQGQPFLRAAKRAAPGEFRCESIGNTSTVSEGARIRTVKKPQAFILHSHPEKSVFPTFACVLRSFRYSGFSADGTKLIIGLSQLEWACCGCRTKHYHPSQNSTGIRPSSPA